MKLAATATDASRRARRCAALLAAIASLLAPALTSPAAYATGDANQIACPASSEASPGFRSYLPDCRAYELVTPPYAGGVPAGMRAVSTDGSSLIAVSHGAFAGLEAGEGEGVYLLARTASGWSTAPLNPPVSDPRLATSSFIEAGTELTSTLWQGTEATGPEAETAPYDLFLRETGPAGEARFLQVGPRDNTTGTPETSRSPAAFAGASSQLTHLLLKIEGGPHTWPGDTTMPKAPSLYEYVGVGAAEPRLVGVRNEGQLDGSPHVNEGAELISGCGTVLGSQGSAYNAISTSGQTVFFTASTCEAHPGEPQVNELYARLSGSKTVAISEPALPPGEACEGACAAAPPAPGEFQGASADGSKVFFLSSQPLINADRDSTTDLYMAEIRDGRVARLVLASEGETQGGAGEDDTTPGEGAHVLGVVRVSEDGSRVYFVAEGVLTARANDHGASAQPGGRNLYVFDTTTGRTAFVGTLQSQAEEAAAHAACNALNAGAEEYTACLESLEPQNIDIWRASDHRAAQATPDGAFLVFTTLAHLTADDTSGPLVPQVFLYTAQTGVLARVAVGDGGSGGDGNADAPIDAPALAAPFFASTAAPTAGTGSLGITDTGAVVFESADGLTPLAVSGRRSVYEYSDGRTYLISDGQDTSARGSPLLATDPSGTDVFFSTADQLVGHDTDTQVSLYDARIGGGFPALTQPLECEPPGCQDPQGLAPPASAPASASYAAGQNLSLAPSPTAAKSRPLTRAQKLTRALRACRKLKSRTRRAHCETRARRAYGPVKHAARTPSRRRR